MRSQFPEMLGNDVEYSGWRVDVFWDRRTDKSQTSQQHCIFLSHTSRNDLRIWVPRLSNFVQHEFTISKDATERREFLNKAALQLNIVFSISSTTTIFRPLGETVLTTTDVMAHSLNCFEYPSPVLQKHWLDLCLVNKANWIGEKHSRLNGSVTLTRDTLCLWAGQWWLRKGIPKRQWVMFELVYWKSTVER